jgi:hypothetical protein
MKSFMRLVRFWEPRRLAGRGRASPSEIPRRHVLLYDQSGGAWSPLEQSDTPGCAETIIPPDWHVELETLAAELGYRTAKAAETQKEFTNLIAAIASA